MKNNTLLKVTFIATISSIISLSSCSQANTKNEMQDSKHLYTNKLINESSPYLLQHAHNPVNWYPWGEEALEKAKKENKLILVSIGYSACHWCHVMEHESFEDPEIAAYMNENFVAIKVDREERPDIDQVYMNAVQLLSGRGGWPLNCIALPDGRPIYGGTYFPPSQWLDMLQQVSEFVKLKPKETEEQAQKLTAGIQAQESIYNSNENYENSISDLEALYSTWKNLFDFKEGGSLGAPKFPLPIGYQFLLFYNYLTGDKDALRITTLTLDKMANGGIYDQIGGGFARYATDEKWIVPHFEKMLYDNGQLVSLYSSAYQKTQNTKYKEIVEETLEFIQRELSSSEGGFYSSLDADSEGVEGKYYVWSMKEIKDLLKEEAELFCSYYNIKERGNWEEGINILYSNTPDETKKLAEKAGISEAQFRKIIKNSEKKLFSAREERIRPGLDDKILAAWNALMLKGYIDAYLVFEKSEYLDAAVKNATFLKKNLISKNGQINRNFKDGKASINGFLDDYAFSISAFTALYRATFDEKWLVEARKLNDYAVEHFYDEKSGMFFYTSNIDPELIARKMEITDNVIPSANSEMAKNLYTLGKYFSDDEYLRKASRMYGNVKEHTARGGPYFANWNILGAWLAAEPAELVILGEDWNIIRKEFEKHYLPDVLLFGGESEGSLPIMENRLVPGQTTIYVCKNRVCQLPTTDVKVALKQIAELKLSE